jgi:ribosomal protein S4
MTKREILIKRLQELSEQLTEEDRLHAAINMACSYETIKRYLSGSVKKEAFANKLIKYLESRIKQAA